MKRAKAKHLDSMIEDLKDKQRNLTWPYVLRGGRAVDEYLWKGARDAPMVQRIGAVLLAVAYFMAALFFVGWATSRGGWGWMAFALVPIAIRAKIVHSATR